MEDVTLEFSIDHTSIFLFGWDDQWSALIDKELTQVTATFRYPLNMADTEVEAGASIPFYTEGGGSFDKIIRWWHNLTGAPSYLGQEESPDFRYVNQLYYHDDLILDGGAGDIFLGDVTLWIKTPLNMDERVNTSFQAFISPPTGDLKNGNGSGAWEAGARVLVSGALETGFWSAGGGLFFPGSLKEYMTSAPLSVMTQGFAAWEYPWTPNCHLVVQSMFSTSPLPDSDMLQLSRPFVDVTFGLTYQRSENAPLYLFGFSENLSQTAPDFTIHLSVRL